MAEKQSFEELKNLAVQGDTMAEYLVTSCLYAGVETEVDHTRAFESFKQAADAGVAETQYVKTGFVADNSSHKLLFQLPDFAQGAFVQDSASEFYVEAETVTVTVMLSPSAEAVNVATPVAKDTEFCVECDAEIPFDSVFCQECGADLGNEG